MFIFWRFLLSVVLSMKGSVRRIRGEFNLTLPNEERLQWFSILLTIKAMMLPWMPLPPEILDLIFESLENAEDIKRARLVCHEFAAAGSRHITKTAYLSKYLYDLERLYHMSRCPHISSTISHLICDDTNFAPLFHRSWTAQAAARGSVTDEYISQKPLSWLLERCEEERRVRTEEHQQAMLMQILPHMPVLKYITVTDYCGTPDQSVRKPERFRVTPFLRTNDWTVDTPPPQPWSPHRLLLDPWDSKSTHYHGLVNIIRAFSLSKHTVEGLWIYGRDTGVSHLFFSMIDDDDFHHLKNVFQNLLSLAFSIETLRSAGNQWVEKTLGEGLMARCLTTATNLTSLEINFMGCENHYHDYARTRRTDFDISLGLSDMQCPLERFILHGCTLKDHYGLTKFLGRHRHTLRPLVFGNIILVRTTWRECWEDFRAHELQLEEPLHLENLWDETRASDEIYKLTYDQGDLVEFLQDRAPNPATVPSSP